ncbi:MAG: exosortase/archaeosortase family protein [Verrucomicrobiota bacterium]|nr:exosortase/archaeosortase family protein [Verrucomicrobiota bacterium]
MLLRVARSLVGFALLWFTLFHQLHVDWSINPQYSYGWGVPFLAAYLFSKRWKDRPAASVKPFSPWIWLLPALALPLEMVQEANPEWRLVSWTYALFVVGLTMLLIWTMGGEKWLRHFSFPLLFVATAVPWPTFVEEPFIRGSMRMVAAFTVDLLNGLGIPAAQRGNLIELATGTVSVDEACSGIRSLQSTIMLALFFGELSRLTLPNRFLLLLLGGMISFCLNLARTFLLTSIAAKNGLGAIEQWHDPAGLLIVCVTFLFLMWLAKKFSGDPAISVVTDAVPLPSWSFSASIIIWLLTAHLAKEFWYRSHEQGKTARHAWSLQWPTNETSFRFQRIPETTQVLLRYNQGEFARWIGPNGADWFGYFLRWEPGRAAAQLAGNHRPESCLPSTGLRLKQEYGEKLFKAGNFTLPVERYVFERNGATYLVFFCLWEDVPLGLETSERFNWRTRLKAVREGKRHLGQRVLEIVIAGSPEFVSAEKMFADFLEKQIVIAK